MRKNLLVENDRQTMFGRTGTAGASFETGYFCDNRSMIQSAFWLEHSTGGYDQREIKAGTAKLQCR